MKSALRDRPSHRGPQSLMTSGGIGVRDLKWDHDAEAVIVGEPATDFPPEHFIRHCRTRMASYKKRHIANSARRDRGVRPKRVEKPELG